MKINKTRLLTCGAALVVSAFLLTIEKNGFVHTQLSLFNIKLGVIVLVIGYCIDKE